MQQKNKVCGIKVSTCRILHNGIAMSFSLGIDDADEEQLTNLITKLNSNSTPNSGYSVDDEIKENRLDLLRTSQVFLESNILEQITFTEIFQKCYKYIGESETQDYLCVVLEALQLNDSEVCVINPDRLFLKWRRYHPSETRCETTSELNNIGERLYPNKHASKRKLRLSAETSFCRMLTCRQRIVISMASSTLILVSMIALFCIFQKHSRDHNRQTSFQNVIMSQSTLRTNINAENDFTNEDAFEIKNKDDSVSTNLDVIAPSVAIFVKKMASLPKDLEVALIIAEHGNHTWNLKSNVTLTCSKHVKELIIQQKMSVNTIMTTLSKFKNLRSLTISWKNNCSTESFRSDQTVQLNHLLILKFHDFSGCSETLGKLLQYIVPTRLRRLEIKNVIVDNQNSLYLQEMFERSQNSLMDFIFTYSTSLGLNVFPDTLKFAKLRAIDITGSQFMNETSRTWFNLKNLCKIMPVLKTYSFSFDANSSFRYDGGCRSLHHINMVREDTQINLELTPGNMVEIHENFGAWKRT